MLISLGNECSLQYQINKIQEGPTHFFDWLLTDFETVLKILKQLHYNPLKKNLRIIATKEKHAKVHDTSFTKFISVHDLLQPVTFAKINHNFAYKYGRRHQRLRKLIQNSSCFVHFIRMQSLPLTLLEYKQFRTIILNINPNLKFKLISIHIDQHVDNFDLDNFQVICYERYLICDEEKTWHKNNYKWNEIWNDILK